jgi:hypothetical protein
MVRRLGVMYIIYNRRIWASYRAEEGWRPYAGTNPHTDHMHFSFSWAGARKQTSYWDGTPGPRRWRPLTAGERVAIKGYAGMTPSGKSGRISSSCCSVAAASSGGKGSSE